MTLTGRCFFRPAALGSRLILTVEEQDANGERLWRDAHTEDVAEGLTFASVASSTSTLPIRREARA